MKKVRKGFALFQKRTEPAEPGIPLCEQQWGWGHSQGCYKCALIVLVWTARGLCCLSLVLQLEPMRRML